MHRLGPSFLSSSNKGPEISRISAAEFFLRANRAWPHRCAFLKLFFPRDFSPRNLPTYLQLYLPTYLFERVSSGLPRGGWAPDLPTYPSRRAFARRRKNRPPTYLALNDAGNPACLAAWLAGGSAADRDFASRVRGPAWGK
jgi:hypothetical protein